MNFNSTDAAMKVVNDVIRESVQERILEAVNRELLAIKADVPQIAERIKEALSAQFRQSFARANPEIVFLFNDEYVKERLRSMYGK